MEDVTPVDDLISDPLELQYDGEDTEGSVLTIYYQEDEDLGNIVFIPKEEGERSYSIEQLLPIALIILLVIVVLWIVFSAVKKGKSPGEE